MKATRRIPQGLIGVVALAKVALVAGVALSVDSSELARSKDSSAAPESNFPSPSVEVLEARFSLPGSSLDLRPPNASTDEARITGPDAVDLAETELGPDAFPTTVTARLAWDQSEGRLVWAVTFEGVCVPKYGPPGTEPGCASDELVAIVDATTGNVDGLVSVGE